MSAATKERPRYYVLDGRAVVPVADVRLWGAWFETADRAVARTKTRRGEVSTVFLGLDHSFSANGPALLFETLVFGGPLADEMQRYATWDDAERGHAAMVKRVRAAGAE